MHGNQQVSKMPLSSLMRMQDKLDAMLDSGEVDITEYTRQWREVLSAAGWSDDEYSDEIDRRWSYIDRDFETPGLVSREFGAN